MNINIENLQKTVSKCEQVNESINYELENMNRILEDISNNIKSSEIRESNKNIINEINNVSDNIKANLPKIIEFLNNQIKEYKNIDSNTSEVINSITSSIEN